jgi:hypothetical protein
MGLDNTNPIVVHSSNFPLIKLNNKIAIGRITDYAADSLHNPTVKWFGAIK